MKKTVAVFIAGVISMSGSITAMGEENEVDWETENDAPLNLAKTEYKRAIQKTIAAIDYESKNDGKKFSNLGKEEQEKLISQAFSSSTWMLLVEEVRRKEQEKFDNQTYPSTTSGEDSKRREQGKIEISRETPIEVISPEKKVTNLNGRYYGPIFLSDTYSPPFSIHCRLKPSGTNIRFRMFGGEVIFNWEVRSNEFRCDIPLARGQHKRGAGNVPRGIWSEITIDVKDREIAFYVNGELRHTVRGNFRGVSTKIGVTPCGDGSFWLSDFGVVK